MVSEQHVKGLILDTLEDQILSVGGCVALHEIPNPAVRRIVNGIYEPGAKVLRNLDGYTGTGDLPFDLGLTPHPAVEGVLAKIQRERSRLSEGT